MATTTEPTPATETVLPRPVTTLPTPAIAAATSKLAEKLTDHFTLSDAAAQALAAAVVDPSTVRKAVETPERLPVPGGTLLAVRADVWARQVMPDPRNPRIGPARRFPVSRLVGRDESTRFRPLAEPHTGENDRAELLVDVASKEHLAWASAQARDYVLQNNNWRDSIKHQGVMTEVWLAAATFDHRDDTPPATLPVTVEGSSRLTAVHDLLDVRSADVPYLRDERKLRVHVRALNDKVTTAGDPRRVAAEDAVALRCETLPALLLVGFEAHPGYSADFATAVKSLVALRHVDPPRPWGAATENEALADAVINELERRGLITEGKAAWLTGEVTPEEAVAAGFSDDPTKRAAAVVRLFTDRDDAQVHDAVRTAVTSQSTRKNLTTKLLLEIGTSLIMRSVSIDDPRTREGLRRWLKDAYSADLVRPWTATFRPPDELADAALEEVRADNPGPASRELATRAAYPLILQRGLKGDLGATGKDEQPDRRKPSEVIERMRTGKRGVLQLRQVLNDYAADRRLQAVDEHGDPLHTPQHTPVLVSDAELRRTYAPPGAPFPTAAPQTTAEVLRNALAELGQAVHGLEEAVTNVEAVQSEDGTPAINTFGADQADCKTWTQVLFSVLQQLPVWGQRHASRNGAPAGDEGDGDFAFDDLPEEEDSVDDDEADTGDESAADSNAA